MKSKDMKEINKRTCKELEKIDEKLSSLEVEDETYMDYVKKRQAVEDQILGRKEEPKILEYTLRYGVPAIMGASVTAIYLKLQDPSQDGKTWKQFLDKIFSFKN